MTRQVNCGGVLIGGGAPVSIQSMTNVDTRDTDRLVRQIDELTDAGCEIVRCAIPDMQAAESFGRARKRVRVPLVADIHFDYRLAIAAIENGADKIRINPGNIGSTDRVRAVVDKARERNIPIRVGVNSGSLEKGLIEKYGGVYIDSSKTDLEQFVSEWTDGKLADVVYECIGAEVTLDQAIRISKPGAKIMVMGVFGKKPVVDMNTLQEAERVLYTSQAHVNEIAVALDFMKEGKINADELITREVTLETLVEDGFEYLIKHGPEQIKVLIRING